MTEAPIWSRATQDLHAEIVPHAVMLGVPCYGGAICEATVRSIEAGRALLAENGISTQVTWVRNESLVQRARNTITAHFLASDCEQLVFIDADIEFAAAHLLRLVAHPQDVVGGLYRKKVLTSVDFAWTPDVAADGTARRHTGAGLIAARHLATGFLKIRRGVFGELAQAFPRMRYRAHDGECEGAWREHLHAFFDCWIDADGHYLSEDYGFCVRCRQLGIELWADPAPILRHHGMLALWADPADQLGGA
jgi:hypothetical protein